MPPESSSLPLLGAARRIKVPPLRDVIQNPNLPKVTPVKKQPTESKRKSDSNPGLNGQENTNQKKPKIASRQANLSTTLEQDREDVADEGKRLLEPLLTAVKKAHEDIQKTSGEIRDDLLIYLEMLQVSIEGLEQCSSSEIAQSSFVNKPYRPPSEQELECFSPSVRNNVASLFQKINQERSELLESIIPGSEAAQDVANSAETAALPIGIQFFSLAYYQYAFLYENAQRWDLSDDEFRTAQTSTFDLIYGLGDCCSDEERISNLRYALEKLFPSTTFQEWQLSNSKEDLKTSPDLVYRRILDSYPLIIATVRADKEKASEAFSQNCNFYTRFFSDSEQPRRNRRGTGAPVIFIQLAGTELSFGGGFYDSSGPPLAHLLPGTVTLEPDFGHNKQLGARSFWALRKCFKSLTRESQFPRPKDAAPTPAIFPNVPRIGLSGTGVTITEVLSAGIVFKARIDIKASVISKVKRHLEEFVKSSNRDECVVKAIYPLNYQRYGVEVHVALQNARFAPKYICELPCELEESIVKELELEPSSQSNFVHLIKYFVMEYLPPPSLSKPGWITLEDLATRYTRVAIEEKSHIRAALDQILKLLQDQKLVHGDLRPNNIMVKISTWPEPGLIFWPDNASICIVVVDYDWAGKLGEARYPSIRNVGIPWPGAASGLILGGHDKEMVENWLKDWPKPLSNATNVQPIRGAYRIDVN